ncbi:uncharacterized protein TOT_020000374 [Theileria orientalis strain Shintoku]|uniref:Serine/threonine specific protein phosphatases domain-containing protein n=1 Tax=Theileria orientalis strain Shintoku TaxID=869250 RepID=J4C3A7_THEOR|nr:uncharacterized protein TOT_020000374 [Theileria orientalis strain Shintoku]BAM40111.1 uncharacterized protein TOT_020000374 [Theileria orientalis strain Shintoku]|eukprot:XP_009690412.1 uncharacterized protein TOT_020000374 [Theileria orientalis strain Shintoku]
MSTNRMDFETGEKSIADDSFKFNKFDSTDFSTKLVTVHTSLDDLEFKSISPPNETTVKEQQLEGAKLLSNAEYNELSHSVTSFNKWFSQTSLLASLVDEDFDLNKSDSNFTGDRSQRTALGKEDASDYEFDFLFKKTDDNTVVNSPVLTFLLTNFNKASADKPLNLREDLNKDFEDFKRNFVSLTERNTNELKLKKVLLSVAFNHYGCSTVNKYMTQREYLNMLNVHKIFGSEEASNLVFESMDRKHKSMVTRNEFVSGMLSCSPDAKHNPNTVFGKLRLQHIFRAYDFNRLGYLERESLDLMQSHLEQQGGNKLNYDLKINEKVMNMFNGKLSYDSFFYCVENNLLKNTTVLFRSNNDLAEVLKRCILNSLENVVTTQRHSYGGTTNREARNDDHAESFGNNTELFHHGNTGRSGIQENVSKPESNRSNNMASTSKASLWSHTPRVYSEFTHNKSPNKEQLFGFNYENKWSKSTDASPKRGYGSPIDRLSKMYNDQSYEDELANYYGDSNHANEANYSKEEKASQNDKLTEQSPKSVFSSGQLPKDALTNARDNGQGYQAPEEVTPSRFDKIDEFLREYEQSYKSPERTPKQHLPTLISKVESFKDAVEDDSRALDPYREPSEGFKSFDTMEDLMTEKAKLDNLLMDSMAITDYYDKKAGEGKFSHRENLATLGGFAKNEKGLLEASATPNCGLERGGYEQDGAREATGRNQGHGLVGQSGRSQVKQGPATFEMKCPDEEALESLTEHLAKKYTHKFLVIKGHLIDCTVAKGLFKNFLHHSLGDSVDHTSLKLCAYSDMLQLCDAACSILKKEDSLLQLKGNVQVFGSLNGDLSCLLDQFNALDGADFKNWDDFDSFYVFMGGFASESSPYALEFALLLFAMKVLFPYHVHFLRSSKDERNATNNAGFYHQIYMKLSENHAALRLENDETLLLQCAKELFHRVNDVFEFMSVGAVLNKEILCVDKLTKDFSYKRLGKIPKPLNLATCTSEQVYDLLFNEDYFSFPPCLNKHEDHQTQAPPFKATEEVLWELGDASRFRMVICSSDKLDAGFKYLLDNRVLLLSTNFLRKSEGRVASSLLATKNKVTLRSLSLD